MKLLVIGHSVVDHVNDEIKPGGIYYSVTGLYNFKNKNDEISLITSVGDGTYFHFENLYTKINNELIQKTEAVPEVFLHQYETGEREECYSNLTEKLIISSEINFEMFDGILINMITGFDISLEDLKFIRSKFGGPIYFDVHTFSRGIDKNNKRYFRKIPLIKEWLKNLDIVQVNETELLTISNLTNEIEIASEVLNYGVKCLVVTKGEKGASIYLKENSTIIYKNVEAISLASINKIGCGDIFGTVFFYSYIKSGIFDKALTIANIAAGLSTTYSSFEEYKNLKNDADKLIN